MATLWQDIRYGIRVLFKSPGFTLIAVFTLALGIGPNTAIFSLVDAVMLKSLPVRDPSRLVLFWWDANKWPPHESQTGNDAHYSFSYPAFEQFRSNTQVLSDTFAFVPLGFSVQNTTVGINGEATLANGEMVTGEYFSGLGVKPLLGRLITHADEVKGAPPVVVLSYAYWSRQFARDPSISGKEVSLNGIPATVVGVTPPAFYGEQRGSEPDLWVAFADLPNLRPWGSKPPFTDSVFTDRNWICLNIMGRLKPGVSRQQAQSALDIVFHRFVIADWTPEKSDQVPHLQLVDGSQGLNYLSKYFSQQLFVLMAVVGLVLLIACANLATLLLARAASRKKEMSVRLAIGASRSRLFRQLITESVLLALIGGALGLLFAYWGTQALVASMSTPDSPTILDTRPDTVILLFTLAASVLTGILFGLAPAFRATRMNLASAMRDAAGSISESRGGHRLGQTLVILQVAASLVLMIGAGLFVRTLENFENKNLGFNQKNLLIFGLDPTRAGYQGARLVTFYQQMLPRIQSLPGVESATLSQDIPLAGWSNNTNITVEGSTRKITDNHLRWCTVGPDFFRTENIPLLLGRGITESDVASSPRVAVVDETFAHKYLGDASPIGQRFYLGSGKPDPDFTFEIVGVVKPAELTDIHSQPLAKAYMAYGQFPQFLSTLYFLVRTPVNPTSLLPEIREAVRQMDPNLPLMDVSTQTELTAAALTQERLFARLSSFFGLLALLVASIGLYGTMAYSVSRKTHEIGIRMALGANPLGVLRMILAQGMKLTFIGVAIGIAGALGATRLVSSMIYGVTPYDPATFAAVAIILVAVALAACYIPAHRAMRVDPMVALRYE